MMIIGMVGYREEMKAASHLLASQLQNTKDEIQNTKDSMNNIKYKTQNFKIKN